LAQQAWQGYNAIRLAQACVVRPTVLLGALGLYILAYFVQMGAWALIMRYLQAPLAPQAVVQGYALSFLPRYIPGSVWGYLSRNEWLSQTHNVGYGVSTTASLVEAALLLVTAGAAGALYWLPAQWQVPFVQIAIAVVGLAATWATWRLLPWLVGRVSGRSIQAGSVFSQSLGLWAATCVLYAGFWLLQGGALVVIAQALCARFALGLPAATAAFAWAWAIGFLIVFVPAGLGVREWTLGALLVDFAMLPPGQASLIALVSRLGLIVAELVVLAIGLHGQIQSWRAKRDWVAEDGSLKKSQGN
jgi:uncharacterized membrane protein YbhN (UPF0104 family)